MPLTLWSLPHTLLTKCYVYKEECGHGIYRVSRCSLRCTLHAHERRCNHNRLICWRGKKGVGLYSGQCWEPSRSLTSFVFGTLLARRTCVWKPSSTTFSPRWQKGHELSSASRLLHGPRLRTSLYQSSSSSSSSTKVQIVHASSSFATRPSDTGRRMTDRR